MSQLTAFLLCIVGASLTSMVSAISEEELTALRLAVAPIISECAAEYEVSRNDIDAAKQNRDVDAVASCFIACGFKKIGVLDSNGLYDAEKVSDKLKLFVQNDEDFAKFESIAQTCAKVNDEPVDDGAKGCERAKQILACAFEHRDEMPF
nr:odorant binding protein 36 [Pagiophloeus tsushimanus]